MGLYHLFKSCLNCFSVRIILSHTRVLVGKTYLKRSLTPSILLKSGFQVIFSFSFVTILIEGWKSVSELASDFLNTATLC